MASIYYLARLTNVAPSKRNAFTRDTDMDADEAWLGLIFFFAVSILDHVHEENAAMACPELGRTT